MIAQLRRLTLAAGMLLLGVRAVAAQQPAAPAPSPVSVTGVVYAQYLYQGKDSGTVGDQNQFSVQRAYVNVIGKFSGGIYTRITADIAPTGAAGASQAYRLKYAYAAWTPGTSALTYKFGLIHTPWVDWEEALWDYRMQGTMVTDRYKYMTSSDFGAGIDGKWNNDMVNGQFAIVNGEGYSGGTGDKRKDIEARVSVRVLETDDASRVGGLRLNGYVGLGTKDITGGSRNRFLGMVSYRSKMLTLAGEFASTKDTTSPVTGTPNATGSIISVFGVLHVPNTAVAVIARFDAVDPNTNVANDKQTRIIAGLSYQISPNLRVLADLDNLTYQSGFTPSVAQKSVQSMGLFQMQFTF